MTTYASARLDGIFICDTLQAGILRNTNSPVVSFTVEAGVQTHPVWALDRLAFVVYSYCRASKENPVEVNLEGTLISNESVSVIVANRIQWHTSRKIRTNAERMISEMRLERWPKTMLELPVSYSDAASRKPGSRTGF
jgi:hypothetical protein